MALGPNERGTPSCTMPFCFRRSPQAFKPVDRTKGTQAFTWRNDTALPAIKKRRRHKTVWFMKITGRRGRAIVGSPTQRKLTKDQGHRSRSIRKQGHTTKIRSAEFRLLVSVGLPAGRRHRSPLWGRAGPRRWALRGLVEHRQRAVSRGHTRSCSSLQRDASKSSCPHARQALAAACSTFHLQFQPPAVGSH